MHRFSSLALKSRIDARISRSSACILSKSPSTRSSRVDDASCLECSACGRTPQWFDSGSTAVRQWRQKRVLMRPEAAFPYVSAAEGAQHPPKKPPRSTPCRSEKNRRNERTAAAKTHPAAKRTAATKRTARHAERTATKTFRRRGITIIPRDRADRDGEEP